MRLFFQISIIFLISVFLFACERPFEKKVYFDLAVGSSKNKAELFYQNFNATYNYNRGSKYPYYTHKLSFGKNYYSTPMYQYPPNDTIVHTVIIQYFLQPDDCDKIIESTVNGLLRMSIDGNYNGVNSMYIYQDVKREIEKKYGSVQQTDTFTVRNTKHTINKWQNKDGINITLDYASSQEYIIELNNYYNLKLEFTLTDENISKLIKNKSIY